MKNLEIPRNPYYSFYLLGMVLLNLALTACGGGDKKAPPSAPLFGSVQVVSGNSQNGAAGVELGAQLVARAVDTQGNPVAGKALTFVATADSGSVFVGATTSDASGEIRDRWTLGTGTGVQHVEIRGADASGTVTVLAQFSATAVAGAPAMIEVDGGTAGQAARQLTTLPSPLAVFALDAFGNPRAGVTVNFAACATCGTVSPASAVTNANGEAQTTWTLGLPVGDQTVIASAMGLADVTIGAVSLRAPPSAPVSMIAQAGDGQAINQHAGVGTPFTVLVSDALGNPVPGVAVSFAAASGSGYLTPATVNTNMDGIAAYQQYIHHAGAQQVEATAAGLPAVTFDVSVAANAYDFDGYYICHAGEDGMPAVSDQFEMVFDHNVPTGHASGGNARAMGQLTFDSATGAFTGHVQFSLDIGDDLTGTFTIDGDLKAAGAGTLNIKENIHQLGTGTWGCDRY